MNNESSLQALKKIEVKLINQLHKLPEYVQLKSIQASIKLFESPKIVDNFIDEINYSSSDEEYGSLTWEKKILFTLRKIGSGYVEDITKVLDGKTDLEGEKLRRRVSVIVSHLVKNETLKIVGKDGRRNKIAIK